MFGLRRQPRESRKKRAEAERRRSGGPRLAHGLRQGMIGIIPWAALCAGPRVSRFSGGIRVGATQWGLGRSYDRVSHRDDGRELRDETRGGAHILALQLLTSISLRLDVRSQARATRYRAPYVFAYSLWILSECHERKSTQHPCKHVTTHYMTPHMHARLTYTLTWRWRRRGYTVDRAPTNARRSLV